MPTFSITISLSLMHSHNDIEVFLQQKGKNEKRKKNLNAHYYAAFALKNTIYSYKSPFFALHATSDVQY